LIYFRFIFSQEQQMITEWHLKIWILAACGAALVGLGKGGLPGAGNITIALYALIFPSKLSVGILLPILIAADITAVSLYRRHALWCYIRKLLPWTLVGIVCGYLLLGKLDDAAVRGLIGWTLLIMTGVHFTRLTIIRRSNDYPRGSGNANTENYRHQLLAGGTGICGGFASMIANAAGPIAALYLIIAGLPKHAFVGTAAWLFLIVNVTKAPFMAAREMITTDTLIASAALSVFAIAGVFLGRWLIDYIQQKWFERLIWVFIIIAGIRLAFF
jgi:uncharacterized membrane protein YfcA